MAKPDAEQDGYLDFEQEDELQKTLDKNTEKYYNILTDSIKKCTNDEHSRRLMYELLKFCNFFGAVVPEEQKMAHAEGKRLVGIFLKLKLDEIDSQLFYQIYGEGVRYEEAILGNFQIPAKQK